MSDVEKEAYKRVRTDLLGYLHRELIGPQTELEELSDLPHKQYYIAAILYPQEKKENNQSPNPTEDAELCEEISSDVSVSVNEITEGVNEPSDKMGISAYDLANVYRPSCMGLSCVIKGRLRPDLHFVVKAAQYTKNNNVETEPATAETAPVTGNSTKSKLWRRTPIKHEGLIKYEDLLKGEKSIAVCPGLSLLFVYDPVSEFLTASLINENVVIPSPEGRVDQNEVAQSSFFQTEFKLFSKNAEKIFVPRKLFRAVDSKEDSNYELLFSKKKTFGVGHGCAVRWDDSEFESVNELATSSLPSEELPNIEYGIKGLKSSTLDMEYLADESGGNRKKIITELNKLLSLYREWIDGRITDLKSMGTSFKEPGQANIEQCLGCAKRIERGINLLSENEKIWTAFTLMNKVMALQQKAEKKEWRAFQLAFILMNLPGLTDANDVDRQLVDLIWFPTGGGKTEAYLGVAVFVIFYRRLIEGEAGAGTAVIMRYTLRLLTTQQLERAARVICACEIMRQENRLLGKDKISIGVWVGSKVTPNEVKKYKKDLDGGQSHFIIEKCPWCEQVVHYIKDEPRIHCTNKGCAFATGLPFLFIDEDIYKNPPSLLIGTVDKFASMSTAADEGGKKDVARIFAADLGNLKLPPSLIIQDELHLISGPLGTMVGLFELVIEELCSHKKISPKIIAATATIRGARQQCESLFGRKVQQFPPPGLSIDNNFFSKELPVSEFPGRTYVGIQASGHTLTTTEVRVMAAIFQGARSLLEIYLTKAEAGESDELYKNARKYIDPYWTLVAYFNSVRELGKCHSLIEQDVKKQINVLAQKNGSPPRKVSEPLEMTSMRKSKEIPDILAQMQLPLIEENCVDAVLTTNMFSVGVDIPRLGVMLIASQPKTNAEYIQASSRVGRKHPGIVCALYDFSRSRDKSYYENFTGYHRSYYRYVEESSLTPFSSPVLDRALESVIVSLLRNRFRNSAVKELKDVRGNEKIFDSIKNIILKRVSQCDARELARTENSLNGRIADLKEYLSSKVSPEYDEFLWSSNSKTEKQLSQWQVLNSMRSVDASSVVRVFTLRGSEVKQDDSWQTKNSSELDRVRSGQLIVPFGIGAIVGLQDNKSILVGYWQNKGKEIQNKPDYRFLQRLAGNVFVSPPTENEKKTVDGLLFPRWGYCQSEACGEFAPIVSFSLDQRTHKWSHNCRKKPTPIIPIRFIAVCKRGHIDDVPWSSLVHSNANYAEDGKAHVLKYFSMRRTGGLGDDFIKCTCNKTYILSKLMQAKIPCSGRHYLDLSNLSKSEECHEEMSVTHTGASSIYFPIIRSSIYIPDENKDKIEEVINGLKKYISLDIANKDLVERNLNEKAGVPKEAAWKLFEKSFAPLDVGELSDVRKEVEYRNEEYLTLSNKSAGSDLFNKDLVLERENEYSNGKAEFPKKVSDIVLVRSLKETRALMGYTRIFPLDSESAEETDVESRAHVVSTVRTDRRIPAIEVRGEGIFFKLDINAVQNWSQQAAVSKRAKEINDRCRRSGKIYGVALEVVTPGFILLHTLAHVLIRRLGMECGYPPASLRERLYYDEKDGVILNCGLLIYTSSGDSDGTLGGLVRHGRYDHFPVFFENAILSAKWCSADPLCIKCKGQGRDALNLAACHSCVLLPETSCEHQNVYLDRGLLIGSEDNLGFFSDVFKGVKETHN